MINFNVEDGLPSDEVYHVMQDSKGYIWISTDQGVARFDGRNFEVFSSRNGLPDDVIFQTFEDHAGRIWFSAFNCRLSYLEDGEIHEFRFNDQLLTALNGNPIPATLKVDAEGNVWIGYNKLGIVKVDTNGKVSFPMKERAYVLQTFIDSIELVYGSVSKVVSSISHDTLHEAVVSHPSWKQPMKVKLDEVGNIIRVTSLPTNEISISTGKRLLLVVDGMKAVPIILSGPIISNDCIDNVLWVGMASGGIQEIVVEDGQAKFGRHLLSGLSVSHTMRDRNGGLWFPTLEKGVFYSANPKIKAITNNLDGTTLSVLQLVALSDSQGVFVKDRSANVQQVSYAGQLVNKLSIGSVRGIFRMDNSIGIGGGGLFKMNQDKTLTRLSERNLGTINDYRQGTNQIICAGQFGTSVLDESEDTIRYYSVGRVFRAIFETDSTALLARFDGVDRINLNTSELTKIANVRGRVEDLKLLGEELFIATRTNGLIIHNSDSTVVLNESNGLPSNAIYCISIVDRDRLLLGTRKGIVFFDRSAGNWNISCLDRSGGLLSNRITAIDTQDSTVVVGTRKGLNIFELGDVTFGRDTDIFLDSVRVSGVSIDKGNIDIQLSPVENSVEFFVSGICYDCRGRGVFLMQVNEKTVSNESGHFELNDLASGDYEIRFMIHDGRSEPIELGAVFHIKVLKPIWERIWVIITCSLLILTAALLLMRYVLRRKMKRDKLISDTYAYQQRALTLQMKPHFIFNSMNSIQNAILSGDKRVAHKYISNLARLMRSNLEHADADTIALSDELDMLKTYFDLEQRRIEQIIELKIELDVSLDTSLYGVPPFILQPLLENCIWHGFNHDRIDEPHITVRVKEGDNTLLMEVEDNGIGIDKAQKKNSLGAAKSSAIIGLRLELLEKQHKFSANFAALDRKTEGAEGTLVRFELPLLLIDQTKS